MRIVGQIASVRRFRHRLHEQGGAVSVLIALILTPVLILSVSLVVDLGNAFNHQRHLQLQADAAALAGAQALGGTCSDATVIGKALQYSSVPLSNTNWSGSTVSSYSPSYNQQIGGNTGDLYEAINSQTYLPGGNTAPTDSTSPTGSPCAAAAVDVKTTEKNLGWYFLPFGLSTYLNAHARVQSLVVGGGFLPFAIQQSAPQSVGAYFVDESTGAVLAGPVALTSAGAVGSGQYASDTIWTASNVSVPVTAKDIGVILALSGKAGDYTCGDPLVVCENKGPVSQAAGSTPVDYLSHIRGYVAQPSTPAGSVSNPIARQVDLSNPSSNPCGSAVGPGSDPYFTNSGANCNVAITAHLDLGSRPNPSGTTVEAALTGSNTGYALTYSGAASDGTGVWTGTVPVTAATGGNGFDLWVCPTSNCNKNKAVVIPHVQATFASSEALAQDVDGLMITNTSNIEQNSYPMCATCTAAVNITADIAGGISDVTSQSAALTPLNFSSTNTSSQTGTVECPPGNNSASGLAATVLTGCAGQFAINTSDPSCANGWPGPGASPGGTNGSGPPADCVQTKNGLASGQVDTAICQRLVQPTNGQQWYPQNNWSKFDPTQPSDGLPSNDSRIINVVITPLGTFTGGGSSYFPISDIATFYVMGWSGSTGGAPCQGSSTGDPSACGAGTTWTPTSSCDPPAPAGSPNARFWGFFIRYTAPNAIRGTQSCKVSALGSCTLAMTQ